MYLVLPEVLSLVEDSRRKTEHIMADDAIIGKVTEKQRFFIDLTMQAIRTVPSFETLILDDHLYLIIPLLLRTASSGASSDNIT